MRFVLTWRRPIAFCDPLNDFFQNIAEHNYETVREFSNTANQTTIFSLNYFNFYNFVHLLELIFAKANTPLKVPPFQTSFIDSVKTVFQLLMHAICILTFLL